MYQKILAIVTDYLIDEMGKDEVKVKNPNTLLKEELNVDSLDRVDLLLVVEAKFELDINDNNDTSKADLKSFYTVKTIREFCEVIYRVIFKEIEERKMNESIKAEN